MYPRVWSKQQQLEAAELLANTLYTKELRRRQYLNDAQIKIAFKAQNTLALENLHVMASVYAQAVSFLEF